MEIDLTASPDTKERSRDRSRRGTRFSDGRSDGRMQNDRSRERDCRRIYVSNVPYEYKWQDLKDLFRKEVADVTFVELFHDESNKPRGCGVVEFEKTESVTKALEKMNRYDLNGRNLVVKEDYGNERDKFGRISKDGGNNGGGGGNGNGGGGNRGMGGGGGNRGGNFRDRDDNRMLVSFLFAF
jgi:RNA recognition motif-containing protein